MIDLQQLAAEYIAGACEAAVVRGDYCIVESKASFMSSNGCVLFSRYFSCGSYVCVFYFRVEKHRLKEPFLKIDPIIHNTPRGWDKGGRREFDLHDPDSLKKASDFIKEIFSASQPSRTDSFVTNGDSNYEYYKNRPAVTRRNGT